MPMIESRRIALCVLTAALLALCAPAAHADILLLKDGRIVERPTIKRTKAGATIEFENGQVLVPKDMIDDIILDDIAAFEPENDEEKAKVEKGLVPYGGKWIPKAKAEKLAKARIAERKARAEEIRQHMLWRNRWKDKTKHFEFEYTVPPDVYQYYADLMEAYFKEFAKTWKIKPMKGNPRLKVCFYTDAEKFQQIGGVGGGVLGYFRFVEPIELNFYYNRLDPRQTEEVMYHEANHYLQMLLDPAFNMPHFPSEALAEYYGGADFDPKTKKLVVGKIQEGRLAGIKMLIKSGEYIGLKKLITTERMYEHYSWGWSLVHFLMGDSGMRKKFEKFVKTLVKGKRVKRHPTHAGMTSVSQKEVWNQFKIAMGLKNPDQVAAMEKAWHAYIDNDLKVTSSRGLEQAARHASMRGYRLKAKRLMREAIEAGSTSASLHMQYAQTLVMDDKEKEAVALLRKATTYAPLEGRVYAELGKVLRLQGDKEAGDKLLKLALELDPDDPWLEMDIEEILKRK